MNRIAFVVSKRQPLELILQIAISMCLLSGFPTYSDAQQIQPASEAPGLETTAQASPTLRVLYSFTGGSDGGAPNQASPDSALVRDWEGNLYGTASQGGITNNYCPSGCGVVFKLDRDGKLTVIHSFSGPPDGVNPAASLILDEEGSLYGTTIGGGNGALPAGTVFKIDRYGHETVLHSFTGGSDGNAPYASVTRDIWGNLYGTTSGGGDFCVSTGGCGVVFKINRQGVETVLHSFSGVDGSNPSSNLTWDEWGNLYGTTLSGGSSNSGVIFKLSLSGEEKVIHNFSGQADGSAPGDMILDPFGNFYGTAARGGNSGRGVVFKLASNGSYSIVHTFQGTDGNSPSGRLLWLEGSLYGTTFFGGSSLNPFAGTIYEIQADGTERVLYTFTVGSDGGNPSAGLITDGRGNFYGTATYGGAGQACSIGCGTVFELKTAVSAKPDL